jgi:hypothetical protein
VTINRHSSPQYVSGTELATSFGHRFERGRDGLSLIPDLDVALRQNRRHAGVTAQPPGIVAKCIFCAAGRERHPVRAIACQDARVNRERPDADVRLVLPPGLGNVGGAWQLRLVGASRQRENNQCDRRTHPKRHGPDSRAKSRPEQRPLAPNGFDVTTFRIVVSASNFLVKGEVKFTHRGAAHISQWAE